MNSTRFVFATSLMLTLQGLILIHSSDANGSIGMTAIIAVTGGNNFVTGWLLLLCLPLTVVGMFPFIPRLYKIFFFVPQVLVTVVYAMGASSAIIKGSYADSILRSHTFILADQVPLFLILGCHMASVCYLIVDGK